MDQSTVSILICSLQERPNQLHQLLVNLISQCERLIDTQIHQVETLTITKYYLEGVEIIVAMDNKTVTTGYKRNVLYQSASGVYSVSIDDDDEVPIYYVDELLNAAENDCDCFAINGTITTNGQQEKKWYISKDLPYIASRDEKGNEIYLRYPNHICPIRSRIAKQFKFPDKTIGEDYEWATQIHNSGLIKTETVIDKPMYHYKFKTVK